MYAEFTIFFFSGLFSSSASHVTEAVFVVADHALRQTWAFETWGSRKPQAEKEGDFKPMNWFTHSPSFQTSIERVDDEET